MVKRAGGKRPKASDHIDFESDNEDLRDDIDKFHDADQKVAVKSLRKKKIAPAREVLNVEGYLSEESDDLNDSSDFDDDDEGVSGNQWGRKRKDFYGTGFVDEDWGGMREEELEAAELEEQDALERQKELDKGTRHVAELFHDEEEETVAQPQQITKETEFVWSLSNVKRVNKKTSELIDEYSRRKDLMSVIVEPLIPVVEALPPNTPIRKQILMVVDVYSSYVMNLLFFLKLKSDSLGNKNATDGLLDAHPVLLEIEKLRKMIQKVDSFLEKNSTILNKLMNLVEGGVDLSSVLKMEQQTVAKKPKSLPLATQPCDEGEMEDEEGGQVDGDGKRLASAGIAKNSVGNKTKKKKDKHAKVANRRRYKEISKKVRSQVGNVRKEVDKYSGEARGIRASTIKSTKLIA